MDFAQSYDIYIHPTAEVESGAKLGAGTKVWRFSHVMRGAVVGKKCSLGQGVFVAEGVLLGNGVKVQNNVSIYKGVTCEDAVFLGPSMVFTNVRNPRAFISRKEEFEITLVKVGASIGANSTVVCGVTIGKYALIAAGAVVTKDVPDFALIVGVPGRLIGYVSRAAEQLEFDELGIAVCPKTKEVYQKTSEGVSLKVE